MEFVLVEHHVFLKTIKQKFAGVVLVILLKLHSEKMYLKVNAFQKLKVFKNMFWNKNFNAFCLTDDKFDKDCITTEQCESKANLVCYPGIFKCNCAVKDAKGGDVWYSKGKTCESIRFGCKENKQCTDKFDHTICENEICKCSSGNYNLTKFCSHSSITTSNILLIVALAFTFNLNYN